MRNNKKKPGASKKLTIDYIQGYFFYWAVSDIVGITLPNRLQLYFEGADKLSKKDGEIQKSNIWRKYKLKQNEEYIDEDLLKEVISKKNTLSDIAIPKKLLKQLEKERKKSKEVRLFHPVAHPPWVFAYTEECYGLPEHFSSDRCPKDINRELVKILK